jgi:hypothetical protein
MPYVRVWNAKYAGLGFVTIGVHSPEFTFEKDLDNVRNALSDLHIDFPIAVDSEFLIWSALSNNYWPTFYFFDAEGSLRHEQYGEGNYERAERVIVELLAEAGAAGVPGSADIEEFGVEAEADWDALRTPETYVGYARGERFSSPGGLRRDTPTSYTAPVWLTPNHWALTGNWSAGRESVILEEPPGRVSFCFQARDVHLVMGSMTGDIVRYRVLLDGKAVPPDALGINLNEQGAGEVTMPRLYQLIRQRGVIEERTVEIEFLDAGAEAFVFTFG